MLSEIEMWNIDISSDMIPSVLFRKIKSCKAMQHSLAGLDDYAVDLIHLCIL